MVAVNSRPSRRPMMMSPSVSSHLMLLLLLWNLAHICLNSKIVQVVEAASVSFTAGALFTMFPETNCTGEPITTKVLEDNWRCVQHGRIDYLTAEFNVSFIQNGSLFHSFGVIGTEFVNIGLDCSDPENGVILTIHENINRSNCDMPEVVPTVRLPPGEDGSNFCIHMSSRSSMTLQCPSPSESPTQSPSIRAGVSGDCVPKFGTNKKTCQNLKKKCGNRMKWTGPGCKKNKKLGDGGCQCKGYCGYQCKKACRKDNECKWESGVCKTKAGEIGLPITSCLPLI